MPDSRAGPVAACSSTTSPPLAVTLSRLVLAGKVWLKWKCPCPTSATMAEPRVPGEGQADGHADEERDAAGGRQRQGGPARPGDPVPYGPVSCVTVPCISLIPFRSL